LVKAGRSFCIASMVAPWRMYSSLSTTMSPLRVLTVTADDLVLELAGLLRGLGLVLGGDGEFVLLSRVICHFSATFSAVWPMW
jgi:hypothetical protein